MKHSLLIVLLLVTAIPVLSQNYVTVTTDQPSYDPGDTIFVSITYWNNADTTTILEFGFCKANFTIDSWCWGCGGGCPAVMTYDTIPPHDKDVWRVGVTRDLSTGPHSVCGWLGSLDSNSHNLYGKEWTSFTIDTTYTLTFNVNDNWNLISLPLPAAETNRETVFSTSVSRAFSFDKGYKSTDMLQHGMGYWMKFNGSQTITVQTHPLLLDTIDVTPGWHIIGSLTVPIAKSALVTIPPGIISDGDFIYDYNGGYAPNTVLEPGHGYWIKVHGTGKIILDGRK